MPSQSKTHSRFVARFSFTLAVLLCSCQAAKAQLGVLSAGNPTKEWRKTQLALLEQQLGDSKVKGELREELLAQQKWLTAYQPGGLTEKPLWEKPESVPAPVAEPIVDPNETAADLRERLLGPKAKPTTKDTTELQELLVDNSGDIGIRQLHLHWLDQKQYRKDYPDEIADAAIRLSGLLEQLKQTEEVRLAQAYCLYRRARALAYRELPDVIEKKPIEDPEKFEAELVGAYNQLISAAGAGRSEFILMDIRMLRRDHFYGQALVLLTDHASNIDRQWFLKKRRDLLREIGWQAPAKEAAELYAKAFPNESDDVE
ncbi:MAG: hypothetical protein R3C53_26545 [Pirellulaceae bacterium]